jgi:FkbM family methyltransferase
MSDSTLIADRDFGMSVALSGLVRRGYSPTVVFDIGAADGQWARTALQTWPQTKVICFEPLPQRKAALEALQDEFPGRVDVAACGVGDADTSLSIGVTDSLFDSSFAYAGKSAISVPVYRLDTLRAQGRIPEPNFVKVDVQGYEKRVIEGGADLVRKADLVLLECQFLPFCADMRTLDQTIAHMASLGFIPYEFVDLLRRPLDGAMGQCDILFARRGHALVSDLRWAA